MLIAYAGCMTESSATSQWTQLAHLLRPQGRKGEVLAELLTDFPDRFEGGARVYLAKPGYTGNAENAREIAVAGHWLPVGRNHGRIVLALEGIDSIEKAEELAGLDVLVPAAERIELEDDAEYISDLIDCVVYDGETKVGRVTGVEFPATADGNRRLADAAPLLTVETDSGDEVLIPYVQSFLVKLSPEDKRIEMKLPEGLVELNRPGS
jgi:16S rRNA processing protein RimM